MHDNDEVAPVFVKYRPETQLPQKDAPVLDWYCPGEHRRHNTIPVRDWNIPTEQAEIHSNLTIRFVSGSALKNLPVQIVSVPLLE